VCRAPLQENKRTALPLPCKEDAELNYPAKLAAGWCGGAALDADIHCNQFRSPMALRLFAQPVKGLGIAQNCLEQQWVIIGNLKLAPIYERNSLHRERRVMRFMF
jgi:hypothetical protein